MAVSISRVKSVFSLYKISFRSKALLWGQSAFYCPPPPLAKPTLLQYDCATIAQYTTPIRPSLCMPYTIQYWRWQYRVKVKSVSTLNSTLGLEPCVGNRNEDTHTRILFRCSPLCEYSALEYACMHIIYKVHKAECAYSFSCGCTTVIRRAGA